jgi:hypothetical protein
MEVSDPPPDIEVRRTHHLSEITKDMIIERI